MLFYRLKYYLINGSRKYMLSFISCYRFCLSEKRRSIKQMCFNYFRHLGKGLSRARPVTSDVSNNRRAGMVNSNISILQKISFSVLPLSIP